MQQRSEEWFAARCGKITGSAFADVMNVLKSGQDGAGRKNLIARLVVERITGKPEETYQNEAMRRGTELEPEAREAYEAKCAVLVDELAFVQHPKHEFIGVSPDGLVNDDGLVEFKCPASLHKHLSAILDGDHADEYKWQLQGQLWVCEKQWVDAVSYCPSFPDELQLAINRVYRDEEAIAELEKRCLEVEQQVCESLERLNKKAA